MCDEDNLTREQQRAIEHWHAVKRAVLNALLQDEADTLIQAAQAVEHCKREIQRLSVTIQNLDPDTHSAVRLNAIERRDDYNRHLRALGPQAGAGSHIVEWLKARIADAT